MECVLTEATELGRVARDIKEIPLVEKVRIDGCDSKGREGDG